MSRLRKIFIPRVCKILLLFFAFAAATDDLVAQRVLLSVIPALNQTFCNDASGDSEDHAWKLFKNISGIESDAHLQNLVIRTYRDHAAGPSIPAPPAMFFRPDRAPPVAPQ